MSRIPPKPDLRTPPPRGMLSMRQLLAFTRRVGSQLGFNVSSEDFASVRDTGHGLHIRRRVRVAALQIETQRVRGYGRACYYALPLDETDGYVTVRVVTTTAENGTITESWTASGDVEAYVAASPPADCAEIDFATDVDPEFDYGATSSVDTDDTVVPWDSAAIGAESIAEPEGDIATSDYEWPQSHLWEGISSGTLALPLGGDVRSGLSVFSGQTRWYYNALRFRLTNTGTQRMKLTWKFAKTSGDVTGDVTLNAGQTSDWIATPSLDMFESATPTIDRVRISPFLSVA